jgi:hypothetical protein
MPYVYDFDALYDFDLSYDGWPLYDTGTPTGITRTGQRLFDLLPEYVRDADTRGELLRFMASIGDAAHPVAKFIDDADPDTSASGTSEPVNPATTPAGWLPWLGWLIGVPVDRHGHLERPLVSVAGRRPGPRQSAAGIQAAVQATLTGNRYCLVTTAVGGDPWAIEVQVNSDEVVDSAATLAAAMREKPAGANLTLTSSTPVTYDDLDTAYTTYSNMTASALTYTELRF